MIAQTSRRKPYSPLQRKLLVPVHRVLNRNAYYPQRTDFTCGPSCLLMLLKKFNSSLRPSRVDELRIWREANMVYMGDEPGPAGCSGQGLLAAALKRGLSGKVHDYFSIIPLTDTQSDDKTQVVQKIVEHDAAQLRALGGQNKLIRPNADDIVSWLMHKNQKVILLVDEFEDGGLHWVVLDKLANNNQDVVVLDPWSRRRIDRDKGQVIPLTVLQRLYQIGPQKMGCAVFLSLPAKGKVSL